MAGFDADSYQKTLELAHDLQEFFEQSGAFPGTGMTGWQFIKLLLLLTPLLGLIILTFVGGKK